MSADRIRRPGSREVFQKNIYSRGVSTPRLDRRERMLGGSEAKSPSDTDIQQRRLISTTGFRIFILVLVASGALFFGGIWRTTLTVGSASPSSIDAYSAVIDDYFSEKWIMKSRLTFSEDDLTSVLKERHPEIQSAAYQISLAGELKITAQLRYPAAVARFAQTKDVDYFIDSTGVPYRASNSTAESSASLPFIQDTTDVEPRPEQAVVSIQVLDFIRLLNQKLTEAGVGVGVDVTKPYTYLLTDSPRSIEVAHSSWKYRVRVTIERGVNDQVRELEQALDHVAKTRLQPQRYIDLRVDDTAYIQ